jgi:hypothetical protein
MENLMLFMFFFLQMLYIPVYVSITEWKSIRTKMALLWGVCTCQKVVMSLYFT